jgi:hypothetical protein
MGGFKNKAFGQGTVEAVSMQTEAGLPKPANTPTNQRTWKDYGFYSIVAFLALSMLGSIAAILENPNANGKHAESGKSGVTTVGRWCDRMIPAWPNYNYIFTITVTGSDIVKMHSKYNDGSSRTTILDEVSSGFFRDRSSDSGDSYQIVRRSGDIKLIDEDGFIRLAKRLKKTPTHYECL